MKKELLFEAMILKEWRKKHKFTQDALAVELEKRALELFPEKTKKLPQTTLASWERGVMPRPFWIRVVMDFTKNKVCSHDFVQSNAAQ